ncbi:Fic family protein [Candidatus Roizmanbacteria bacterium]|nr:Fic family protein [Candidatus Roizmanbacteria bacterium]
MAKSIAVPPSNWMELIQNNPNVLSKSQELFNIIEQAQNEYTHWNEFKHFPMPKGIKPEEAWARLKFTRLTTIEAVPVKSKDDRIFHFSMNKTIFQMLSYIDTNASGFLVSDDQKPTTSQKDQLILSGITEEAIASSQLEGASTSRKVAKEMIYTNRKPRTHSEQMIVNNFQVMQGLSDWKNKELRLDMLLNIQSIITQNTLENTVDSGRLREDVDNIQVVDALTGDPIFIPPNSTLMRHELDRLIHYANEPINSKSFTHPVIKACILHFWLAYLHPFIDGNGRTARALFYWYLLKHNYWLFKYLSVSRIIKKSSKIAYDRSFVYSENDDNDMTYFIFYNLKVITQSISEFIDYYEAKVKEETKLRVASSNLPDLNDRQVKLLLYSVNHPHKTISINQHQTVNQIAYETARRDLTQLENKGYYKNTLIGKKYVYMPCIESIQKLLNSEKN